MLLLAPWKPKEGTKSQRAKVMHLEGAGARLKRRWKSWSGVALLTPVQVGTRVGVSSQQGHIIGSEVDKSLECDEVRMDLFGWVSGRFPEHVISSGIKVSTSLTHFSSRGSIDLFFIALANF